MTNSHDRQHGYIEAKLEANTVDHAEIKEMLKEIKKMFQGLPCGEVQRKVNLYTNKYFLIGFFVSNLALIATVAYAFNNWIGGK